MPTNPATVRINDIAYTLHELERDCWKHLVSAPESPSDSDDSGFKTMTLATRTLHESVDARTVVLRQTDISSHTLWFHTDVRAEKLLQLEAFPEACLLFWNEKQQVQLRLQAEVTIHIDDAAADTHWKSLRVSSRKMYLSEYKPGSLLPGPYPGFPEALGQALPSEADSEAGRKNFAAVECRILDMEYLHLSRSGQTRAHFRYEPELIFDWLAP